MSDATRPKGYAEGYNEFLVGVFYKAQTQVADPDRNVMRGYVLADMGMAPPIPPLTIEEMQPVAYAAKMALYKVLRKRKKAKQH